MRLPLTILGITFATFLLILFGVNTLQNSFTGAFVVKTITPDQESGAWDLNRFVNKFFNTGGILFPQGSCGDIAEQLYQRIAHASLQTTSGYSTKGNDRTLTTNFVIEWDDHLGTLDLVKGTALINDGTGADSFLTLHSQTVVRVPKKDRITFVSLDLYGTSQGIFVVEHGKLSTPSLDCSFTSDRGKAVCDCKAHSSKEFMTEFIT